MNIRRCIAVLAALAAMAGLAGCSKDDETTAPGVGRVTVNLTDAPGVYNAVNINVTGIAVHQSGTDSTAWETIRSDSMTVDLITLQNGVIRQVGATNVPAGHYTQVRLLVGNGSTVVVDGVTHPLIIPSALQTGIKIVGGFDVPPGGAVDLTLDFDAQRSIVVTGAGDYMLKPVIHMVVNRTTNGGAITGRLVPDSVAATVYALNGPDTVQTTHAALNGTFTLATLAIGTYTVAVHPDTAYRDTMRTSVAVTAGHTTNVGDIILTHEPIPAPVVATRRRQ